jgi:hypothetical protein
VACACRLSCGIETDIEETRCFCRNKRMDHTGYGLVGHSIIQYYMGDNNVSNYLLGQLDIFLDIHVICLKGKVPKNFVSSDF